MNKSCKLSNVKKFLGRLENHINVKETIINFSNEDFKGFYKYFK